MSALKESSWVSCDLASLKSHTEGNLFAVLDACGEPHVPGKVDELGSSGNCLYSGKSKDTFREIAPYLVVVDRDFLDWIMTSLSGRPWGILMVSDAPLLELRRHLRRFLLVKLPDQRSVYFRFYDPRVITTFLDSCSEQERADFFGPIERFIVPHEGKDQFLEFARARR